MVRKLIHDQAVTIRSWLALAMVPGYYARYSRKGI